MSHNIARYLQRHAQLKQNELFISLTAAGKRVGPCQERTATWGEFLRQVQTTAGWLQENNVTPNSAIWLVIRDRFDWLKTFFAASYIGAVPIIVNFSDRFHFRNALDSRSQGLICTDDPEILKDYSVPTRQIITIPGAGPSCSAPDVAAKTQDDVFFGIFTSGSTGQPKYIEKSYGNVMTELKFLMDLLEVDNSSTVFALAAPVHIYGLLLGVLLPTMAGAKVIQSQQLLPRDIIRDVIATRADILISVPLHYQAFAKADVQDARLPNLRRAVSSGAALPAETADVFCQRTGVNVLELYGSTETGGIAHRSWGSGKHAPAYELFPYVRVTSGSESRPHELVVQSPTISTNALVSGEPRYRTGDIVERVAGQRFRIVSRCEQIIKVGGKRVAAVQLEHEFKALAAVHDAAVIRITDSGLRAESAVAFVQLNEDTSLSSAEIRALFGQVSIHSGVVSEIRILDKIPRLANGKTAYPKLQRMFQHE